MSVPAFTNPSLDPETVAWLESGVVFQALSTETPSPILSFAMTPPSYHRKRLRHLVRFHF